MGQLRWSQNRVLVLESQRVAKNNKIRPNATFLRSILTEVRPFEKKRLMMSSTAQVHTMVSSTLLSSISDAHICTDCSLCNTDKNKVEETMACTSAVDDIIHRYFRRAVSRLILNVETWGLDGSYYFWLFFEIQASKHDSVTSSTDPFIMRT